MGHSQGASDCVPSGSSKDVPCLSQLLGATHLLGSCPFLGFSTSVSRPAFLAATHGYRFLWLHWTHPGPQASL